MNKQKTKELEGQSETKSDLCRGKYLAPPQQTKNSPPEAINTWRNLTTSPMYEDPERLEEFWNLHILWFKQL